MSNNTVNSPGGPKYIFGKENLAYKPSSASPASAKNAPKIGSISNGENNITNNYTSDFTDILRRSGIDSSDKFDSSIRDYTRNLGEEDIKDFYANLEYAVDYMESKYSSHDEYYSVEDMTKMFDQQMKRTGESPSDEMVDGVRNMLKESYADDTDNWDTQSTDHLLDTLKMAARRVSG